MKTIKLIVELGYDETQDSPDVFEQVVKDILEAHEHYVNEVRRVSVCCECPVIGGICQNCNDSQ